MSHLWKQTINIDAELAKSLIQDQFNLPIHTLTLLDEGWDNVVYLVNDALIFRFPRREFSLACMKHEIALLPYLAQQLSFPISSPQWIGHPTEAYPYPFSGYPILPGKSLCDASNHLIEDTIFASTLAAWLKELHAIPIRNTDLELLKGTQDWRLNVSHRIKRCQENLDQYGAFFEEAGFNQGQLIEVIDKLRHSEIDENKKSYVHADLYHRHILVDSTPLKPTGIIDWGDVHISHPGIDLSVGMIFTPSVYQHFLEAYGEVDQKTLTITHLNSFAHAMSFLPYAYERNQKALKLWAYFQLHRVIEEIQNN